MDNVAKELVGPTARLHDGTHIAVLVVGAGPQVLLPVRAHPHDEATAAGMRQWGADPDAGPTLVHGLADRCTVVAADYEGHRLAHPAPCTLTAANVVGDLLAIADAAGAQRFWCYGYSWLALAALQLAVRTDRLAFRCCGAGCRTCRSRSAQPGPLTLSQHDRRALAPWAASAARKGNFARRSPGCDLIRRCWT